MGDHTDDGGQGDAGADGPGGGPKRVVSDKSVDDILNSLNETQSSAEPPQPEPVTSTREDSDGDETLPHGPSESAEKAIGTVAADGPDESPTTSPQSDANELETSGGDAGSEIEAHNTSSSPDPAEGLETRIEQGTVTGADVRAAEAGEGRERTPDVSDIDLSLDDLEGTPTGNGATATETDATDAAGPLAGSLEESTNDSPARETATEDEHSDDDSEPKAGFLARIRGFFSS